MDNNSSCAWLMSLQQVRLVRRQLPGTCDGGVFRQPQMEGGGVVLGQPKVGVLNWGNKEIGGEVVFKGRVLLSFACQKMKGRVL